MLEKYRLPIGLGLIAVIVLGSAVLIWQRSNYNNSWEQEKLAAEVEINNLKKENQDLKDKLAELEKNNQGQVAGISTESKSAGSSSSESSAKSASGPSTAEGSSQRESASSQRSSALVNINTADAKTLESLPGIGPTRAQQIIEYRQSHGGFKTIEEIQNIKGIGSKTYEKLKDLITVD